MCVCVYVVKSTSLAAGWSGKIFRVTEFSQVKDFFSSRSPPACAYCGSTALSYVHAAPFGEGKASGVREEKSGFKMNQIKHNNVSIIYVYYHCVLIISIFLALRLIRGQAGGRRPEALNAF